jgi:transketolase
MRRSFVRVLTELAEDDDRIVLLTADLGFSVLEDFAERFPERFFNVGVAEQNMVGLATGLAEAGFVPFVYSIATFASMRCYEFVRNGPVLHRLPVRVIGVGGGFEYGEAGPTHHALEDVGIMRLQPGLAVVCPADHEQAASALRATWDRPGPIYYRIGKNETATVPGLGGRFRFGRCERLGEGQDALILAMGALTTVAAEAADVLGSRGVRASVAVVSTVNPPPDDLADLVAPHRIVCTVEGHYTVGGLGSLVSEVVAGRGLGCRVIRCGVACEPGDTGSEAYLYGSAGLSSDDLVETVLHAVGPAVVS